MEMTGSLLKFLLNPCILLILIMNCKGYGVCGVHKSCRKRSRAEMRKTMIPKDPVMLLSFVNLKLRDYYGSLEALCEGLDVSESEIVEKLEAIHYHYDSELNQFK